MAAQLGTAIALEYGTQGLQQVGDALVLSYDAPPSPVRQRVVSGLHAPWARSRPQAQDLRAPYDIARETDTAHRAPWAKGHVRNAEQRAPWLPPTTRDVQKRTPWGKFARRAHADTSLPWARPRAADLSETMPWGAFALHLAYAVQPAWRNAVPADLSEAMPWGKFARRPALLLRPVWRTAKPVDLEQWIPWTRFSRQIDTGWGVVVPDGNPPTDEHGTLIVPILRTYIVLNSITLHRVDTGAELRAHSLSLKLDYRSWTWTWEASLHHDATPHLDRESGGDPPELQAVVNGVAVRLRLERIVEDQRFLPQVRWAVSGKGKAGVLRAPYAPNQSFGNAANRTAQQLAEEALTLNGVGIGWTLDWGIADWLVPGGAWGLQGSHIDAINDIASAAGGYVQPHLTDAVLRVLPLYPVPPWEWGSVTPDLEIPGAATEVVGIEYVDKPDYNRVFLGGLAQGVFGPFTRTGTAGNLLAPPVNHALITHADAHRARGIAELSDTGRQEHISLRLPVLPETGIVMPGLFVRHVGRRTVKGLVRSVSIDYARPALRQTIEIETHAV